MIKHLNWDSDFFGFPVGTSNLNIEPNWDEFIPEFKNDASAYKLIYFVTAEHILLPEEILNRFNGRLINKRISYRKYLKNAKKSIPDNIVEYKGRSLSQDFITLAHLAGNFSRFRIDSNMPAGKYEELYEIWIEKSLDRTIADKVFVSNQDNRISAMVSCKYNEDICNIGLIAVNYSEQGKGTGKHLIQITENHAANNGLKEIQVSTQSNNKNACRFYEKSGFKLLNISNYYHFWIP